MRLPAILRSLAAVLVVGVALAACGDSTGPDDNGGGSGGGTATLRIGHDSDPAIYGSIWYVYFSKCSDPNWGDDRLGASEVINLGQTRSWTIDAGCWDMKVEFQHGRVETKFDVQIAAGELYSWNIMNP